VASRSCWGGRYSYTWSRLEDNQFGEDSSVRNPFFGIPQAGELGTRETVPLGQLLEN
jgi:hypothetical protein